MITFAQVARKLRGSIKSHLYVKKVCQAMVRKTRTFGSSCTTPLGYEVSPLQGDKTSWAASVWSVLCASCLWREHMQVNVNRCWCCIKRQGFKRALVGLLRRIRQVRLHLYWKHNTERMVCLNNHWYSNLIMGLSLKLIWKSCLRNAMLIFKEQQQNTSLLIELLWKSLTKS